MTNPINTFSKNPNKVDTTKQEEIRNTTKQEIKGETRDKITTEQFRNMTLESFERNTRIVDGKMYILGKDINYFYNQVLINDEDIDKIDKVVQSKTIIERFQKQFKLKSLLNDISSIWQTEALQIAGHLWFKGYRKGDNIILDNVETINSILKNFGVPVDEKIFNTQVLNIFKLMEEAENQRLTKGVIGREDFFKVKKLFLNKGKTIKQKQIGIFNLMRYGGWSGNSKGVKEKVADTLIEENTDFQHIQTFLNNAKLDELIENDIYFGSVGCIQSCLVPQNSRYNQEMKLSTSSLVEDLSKLEYKKDKEGKSVKLGEKLAFVLAHIITKKEELVKKELKKTFKEKKKTGEIGENDTFELFLDNNKEELLKYTLYEVKNSFKHILLRQEIEAKGDRGTEKKSLTGIYANITGLGETEGWDYTTMPDKYIDLTLDFITSLAIGAMTMGAGMGATLLTRGLLTSTRVVGFGTRIAEGLKIANYLEKGTKIGNIARFLGTSTYEGISFYEGATFMQNSMFREKEDWNKGLWDKKELVKNIAFMGGLNSLKFLSNIEGMSKIMNFEMKIPEKYLKPGNFKKVLEGAGTFGVNTLRDGTTMFGISQGIDIADLFLEGKLDEWHPTVREYLEFVVLIQLMHLKDIRKNNKLDK